MNRSEWRRTAGGQGNTGSGAYEQLWLQELMSFAPQSRILQRWAPKAFMDSGTFSRVFLVEHRQTGEEAVLKFIASPMELSKCGAKGSPEDSFNRARHAAGRREAEIMSRFRGEKHVVQYLQDPEYLSRTFVNTRGEEVWQYAVLICMPLYQSHKEWTKQVAGNSKACLRLGLEMAYALTLFEEKGVFHRDIKPGNILMDETGHFYLSDVGEAKLESDFTTIGFHGTRPYMAPEVYRQENEAGKMRSDHRSDIYSLGIVLYRLFNDQQFPFLTQEGSLTEEGTQSYRRYEKKHGLQDARSLPDGERAQMLRYDGAQLPAPRNADAQTAEVILRACAYDRNARYQSADDLYDALLCCRRGKPLPRHLRGGGKGKKAALAAGAAVLIAMLAGGGTWMLGSGGMLLPQPTPTPTATPTATPTPSPIQTAVPVEFEAGKYTGLMYGDGTCGIVRYIGNYRWKVTSLELPSRLKSAKVTRIEDMAFYGYDNLRSIKIQKGVKSIGYAAFFNCEKLNAITLHEGLTEIGSIAFSGCNALKKLTIPDSVEHIGSAAFAWCNGLTSVTLGEGMKKIDTEVFRGCVNLKSITIPPNILEIADNAFEGCIGLEEIVGVQGSAAQELADELNVAFKEMKN